MDINGVNKIYKYENGFLLKHSGEHLHFLLEDNELLYFSDLKATDSSSIVLLYSGIDVVDEVNVLVGSHSPVEDAALMYNGVFTFLHSNGGVVEHNDIMQLVDSPQASVDELSHEFSLHPNPILSGQEITLMSEIDGDAHIITAEGKYIKSCQIVPGKNTLPTSDLSSGLYFISFKNHTQQVVVN